MRRILPLLCILLLAAPMAAIAGEADAVSVRDGWIRLLPGPLPAGGFMVLANAGDRPAELVGATSTAWGDVMLHRSRSSGGTSHMEHVEQVAVPPQGELAFAPGGYHLMLMHRQAPVEVGQRVVVTLHFADDSTLDAEFEVRPANTLEGDNE